MLLLFIDETLPAFVSDESSILIDIVSLSSLLSVVEAVLLAAQDERSTIAIDVAIKRLKVKNVFIGMIRFMVVSYFQ
ncbi:hypothetical protein IMPR6_470034 [Imperialibacter sp. EC-SDR9]|nr:hypothetical protein IMPERIA75_190033 [Imperialibacter sp. 75]CAD5281146.1 hypothetical protein IMPERIA89_480033 [Imperialibacter sp. 89]VVT28951.1 hypothetical protein IMPR6_470034 [Imperialibacter sp. EC-SDR9]